MLKRLICAALLTLPAFAATTVLYNDSLPSTPGAQGWLLYGGLGGTATESLVSGGTRLVTDNAASAGYANRIPFFNTLLNPAFPTLNRAAGYSLSFELQVNSETHSNNDRAGFSVILISQDLFGIELGFWTNEIWAQSGSTFTHAEGAAFDTTTAQRLFELQILGDNYTLLANGSPILTGALRNYSSFGNPYNLPTFLFLGDDTTSAGADIVLGQVTLFTDIPEPATAALFALAGILAVLHKQRS